VTISWPTRSALRLYPSRWRAENEAEVLGTLLDVASAQNRATPPLAELIPLAARGVWMRARTSVAFWAGLAIIVVMVGALGTSFDGYLSERYWPALLAHAGFGLVFALPVAGGVAAYATASRPAATSIRLVFRNLLMDVAAPAIAVAVGYLATIVAQLVASGVPVTANFDWRIPLVQLVLLAGALAFGALVGSALPRVLASALTAMLLVTWYGLMGGLNPAWSNLSGSTLMGLNLTLYDAPSISSLGAAAVFAAGATVVALALIAVRAVKGLTWFGLLTVGVAAAVALSSPTLLAFATTGITDARDASAVECGGSEPEICLWPEQEAADGELVRETIGAAYARAKALGLPAPSRVSVVANFGGDETSLYWRLTTSADRLVMNYAQSLVHNNACEWQESETNTFVADSQLDNAVLSAEYATAVALGAEPDFAIPTIQTGGEASEPATKTLTVDEARDHLGVGSQAQAREVSVAWFATAVDC